MTTAASAPARRLAPARWLDVRSVLGIALLLGSVVGGARLFAAAGQETTVWAAAHDLVPGEQISAADLAPVRVRLTGTAQRYLAAGGTAVGYVVTRFVGSRELVPAGALTSARVAAASRLVTVPVLPGHLPPGLGPGTRVDVYLTPRSASASVSGAGSPMPTLVLAAASVQARPGGDRVFGADSTVSVVLVVPAERVADVVHAVEAGTVDLVMLPAGSSAEASA